MKIKYSLSGAQVEEIISWLYQEWKEKGSSFYLNQNKIEKSYEEGRILGYENNNTLIGFLTWEECSNESGLYISLDIMAIHPGYRRKGIGEKFYKLAENYFFEREAIAVKLFCSPMESEPFWKAMGFQKYPDTAYAEHPLTYYTPLIEHNRSTLDLTSDRLELQGKRIINI